MNNATFFHNKGVLISEKEMRAEHVYPVYNDFSGLITPMDLLDICRDTGQEIYGAVGDPEIRYTHDRRPESMKLGLRSPVKLLGKMWMCMPKDRASFYLSQDLRQI
jgi:hypothetical protein